MAKKSITEQEFVKAYDTYADGLLRHCYFKISNYDKAVDMVSDVFMKSWDYIQKGNEVLNLKAFLFKVAGNLIIDEYRKKKSVSLDSLVDEGFNPPEENSRPLSEDAEITQMLSVLKGLPDSYREVLTLRYVEGLTPREIAEIHDESENAISVRINRGVEKLRGLMHIQK